MRLLRAEEEVPPHGAAIPIDRLRELARRWYGDRLDPGWRPRSVTESQRILDAVGLRGDPWRLA